MLLLLLLLLLFIIINFYYYYYYYYWKRPREWVKEGQRERGTEDLKQALQWQQWSHVGLELMNHEIMTWAKVGRSTNWGAPLRLPAFNGSRGSVLYGCLNPVSSSDFTWTSLCVCVFFSSLSYRILVIGFRVHLGNPGWSCLKTLNLIIPAKILLPFFSQLGHIHWFQELGCRQIFLGGGNHSTRYNFPREFLTIFQHSFKSQETTKVYAQLVFNQIIREGIVGHWHFEAMHLGKRKHWVKWMATWILLIFIPVWIYCLDPLLFALGKTIFCFHLSRTKCSTSSGEFCSSHWTALESKW